MLMHARIPPVLTYIRTSYPGSDIGGPVIKGELSMFPRSSTYQLSLRHLGLVGVKVKCRVCRSCLGSTVSECITDTLDGIKRCRAQAEVYGNPMETSCLRTCIDQGVEREWLHSSRLCSNPGELFLPPIKGTGACRVFRSVTAAFCC
jgi:hypothetical protein